MSEVALITGASAGLGVEFARQLAARGCDLVLVARREDRLRELAERLTAQFGRRCEILVADLATDAGIALVCEKIAALPRLGWLVNNAGFATKKRFHAIPVDDQDRMHRLHVLATVHLTRAALGKMVAANAGRIINVASVAGFFLSIGGVSYAATKAWMRIFTEGLEVELESAGSAVRVQALCPGYTRTEFHDVLGMERSVIPDFLWLEADYVVRKSLEAIDSGPAVLVPNWKYRLLVALSRVMPRAMIRAAAVRVGRRTKRE